MLTSIVLRMFIYLMKTNKCSGFTINNCTCHLCNTYVDGVGFIDIIDQAGTNVCTIILLTYAYNSFILLHFFFLFFVLFIDS